MRPAGRDARESLYFDYPQFRAPADRTRLSATARVAIVGAGPVGLTAALTLARYGIASVVFEANQTFNDGSRAICLARQSMHIFQTIGAIESIHAKALPYSIGRSYFRGTQILRFGMPDSAHDKYRPMYNVQQQYIEKYLFEATLATGLVEVRWCSRVVGVADENDGVRLEIEDSVGRYFLQAGWCLAADGSRSEMRRLRKLRLAGDNHEGRYVIADIRARLGQPTERIALFDPASRRGGTVLLHRQPEDIWRIDYQLRTGEDEEKALRETAIREGVAGVLSDIGFDGPWDLEWWSVYSANTLALEDYRSGRVFFIGDSAHIVPIFGVRGLNNGLADAQNIGWKLAWVLRGRASASLLDTYTPERRGATLDVFANATKSTRFMTPPTHGWRLLRDAALSLALRHPFAGRFANPRNMTPYRYETNTSFGEFDAGPMPGAVALNVRDRDGYLLDRVGKGFTLLTFGEADAAAPPDPGLHRLHLPAAGVAARRYGAAAGSGYLLRPDQHVLARWEACDAAAAANLLHRYLEGGTLP